MEPFERDPRARAALAQRLAAHPPWREAYARTIATLPAAQLRARGEILRTLFRHSGPGGCAAVGGLVSALVNQGLAGDADALWRAGCPGQGAGLLGDGTFAGADLARRDSLFSWWAPADSDVSTFVDDRAPPGSPRIVVASTSPFVRPVVSRMVYLSAGRYRLQWQAITADGGASDRITALLACREGIGSPVPATIDPHHGTASAEVAVDGECPARWLSFRIAPGSETVRFGNVRLAKVSAGRGP